WRKRRRSTRSSIAPTGWSSMRSARGCVQRRFRSGISACRGEVDTGSPKRTCANEDRKSTRLNSSHVAISYAVFCLKKKKIKNILFYFVLPHQNLIEQYMRLDFNEHLMNKFAVVKLTILIFDKFQEHTP